MEAFKRSNLLSVTLHSLNLSKKRSFLLGLILSFSLQGLANSSPKQTETGPQTPPKIVSKLTYPADVLVGTDIKKLNSFRFSDGIAQVGMYSSENGGSTCELKVRTVDKALEVIRVFREPGERPKTKVYANLKLTTKGMYQSKGALLQVIDNGSGLLLLERASGVESIPNLFWTLYEFKKKNL